MNRPGRKKILNPIAIYLDNLMKQKSLTKEQICVASDLRYHTLDNLWKRRKVSYTTIKALKFAGVITDTIEKEYDLWFREHAQK